MSTMSEKFVFGSDAKSRRREFASSRRHFGFSVHSVPACRVRVRRYVPTNKNAYA